MSQNEHLRPGAAPGYDSYARPVPNVFRNLYDEILTEAVPQGLLDTVQSALDHLDDEMLARLSRAGDGAPPQPKGEASPGADGVTPRPNEASP